MAHLESHPKDKHSKSKVSDTKEDRDKDKYKDDDPIIRSIRNGFPAMKTGKSEEEFRWV